MASIDTRDEAKADGVNAPDLTIALDPHRPGVERGRLEPYGIPVWALVGYMGGEDGEVEASEVARTAEEYGVPESTAWAAVAYYRQHRHAIDALLASHRAAAR